MDDTAKYLIHADLVADGVIERSDVVGAAFGQTEGLLGEGLDIRNLQDSAKLGRIDVSVESEGGQSYGHITIASSLDRVETATLAAALEAVERIGPCRARVEVQRIEDVRAAKRREVVERAKELLATAFDDGALDSEDILQEVRESARVEDITEYEGYPAGPNVDTSDALVVVEGRADVLTLLQYGIKNAVAVEGTNVPDAVADLTRERTATAFLDGDRGGDLIRRELEQVAALDYVARAPQDRSVEDLSREEVHTALREKTPASSAVDVADRDAERAATDGSATPAPPASSGDATETPASPDSPDGDAAAEPDAGDESSESAPAPMTLADHVHEVASSGRVRLLDDDLGVLAEDDAAAAFDVLEGADPAPHVVVLDGTVTQRLLDLAAQRGVGVLVGSDRGEFVKQPASVRVQTADAY